MDDAEKAELIERALDARGRDPVTPETMAAYAVWWVRWEEWCHPDPPSALEPPVRWWTPCPAALDGSTLASFVADLAEAGTAPGTIRKAVSAVLKLHRLKGESVPDDLPASVVLRGHKARWRDAGLARQRAEPLALDDLVGVLEATDRGRAQGRRDACLAMLAYAGLLTAQQLVDLNVGDVDDTGQGLAIAGTREPLLHWTIDGAHHPVLCPVEAVMVWVRTLTGRDQAPGSPLLRAVDTHDHVAGADGAYAGWDTPGGRMTKSGLQVALAGLIARGGLAGRRFTLGSLHDGGLILRRVEGTPVVELAAAAGVSTGSARLLAYVVAADAWAPASTWRRAAVV